jgi:RNA polymerase sigma factor (sigma-70 family)
MNRDNSHEYAENFVQNAVADFQSPLTRYATRLVADPDRARDIVQDTFVKLMGQPPAAVNGHLAEWLFTVCRHRALDVMRKEGRMKRFEEGEMERVSTGDPRPTRSLEAEETHDALLRMIDRLPPNQQEVLRLKFQSGFSYKEISRITAHSVSHVGVLIHHAVTRLRAEYAAQRT